jgi:hypothetical protein
MALNIVKMYFIYEFIKYIYYFNCLKINETLIGFFFILTNSYLSSFNLEV